MEKEKISGIKQQCFSSIDSRADAIFELGRALFAHPELGFKEFETKRLLLEFLTKEGFTVQQEYARTGFQISIGSGHPHIALIAEMDAIPTPGHPMANHADQEAAHSCGHSSQCAIAVAALLALKDSKAVADGGMVSLFFTPAEEYTDMEFRKELIAKGEIQYPAGKIQMLADGVLKDVDVCLHMHAMGESKYHFAVDSSLAGFIYKKFIFHGRGAHAAVLPHLGVNALNAFALFQSAAGMLRETFVDEATKKADCEVVYAKSFYAGAANANTKLAGEIIGILAAPNPAEAKAGLEAAVDMIENVCHFVSANEDDTICYYAHCISRTGSYLSEGCGIKEGEAIAYLIAPPLEAMFGVDAALKAADVKCCVLYAPPSETNFGGALLTGSQSACKAACDAFAYAVEAVADRPIE